MSMLFQAITGHARQQAEAIAVEDANQTIGYEALMLRVMRFSSGLGRTRMRVFGLLADNSVDWVIADLAVHFGNAVLIPLPVSLSVSQLQQVIHESGMEGVLTDRPAAVTALLDGQCEPLDAPFAGQLTLLRLSQQIAHKPHIPAHTAKISYTSASGDQPRGACLSRMALENVAQSLLQATRADEADRHVCLLPLSNLLENIGGVYVPLLAGATVCLPPSEQIMPAADGDGRALLEALHAHRGVTGIIHATMLPGLVDALRAGAVPPSSLRILIVSGAPHSPHLLQQAHQLGLPIFEGYGLTECASLVALNTPEANHPGSVGKPLQHVKIRCADNGEILVGGSLFEGYLGRPEKPGRDGMWPTGDLGHLDSHGYLHLTGHRHH